VKKAFKESPRYSEFRTDESFIRVIDRKGSLIYLSAWKQYLLIIVGALSETQAKEIFAKIKENIENR